ncbi:MAG: 16S rRNA (cytidine(1402)-2'-O)-methyltransferase [Erysipelothrix sp.]|nr:16S rRNA (cytidine(1402)-2'-O)-methyltransferase [Erysipelothrix sp.]
MKIQKSFETTEPTLYIVATPIGNLGEMTPRAIEILKAVDIIAAEDTRNTGKLLKHFGIETPSISYHKHNEKQSAQGILKLLDEGKSVALVSDAGYPLISDPGQTLVSEVIEKDYAVVPISGSSAFINALVVSGIVTQPFSFMGFLESKDSTLKKQLEPIKNLNHTLIFYLSVHRVEKTLSVLHEVLGNRRVSIARELTKKHEEIIRGNLMDIIDSQITLKGEFVIVVEGFTQEQETDFDSLMEMIQETIEQGLTPSRAISQVAKQQNVSKNELYNYYQTKRQ